MKIVGYALAVFFFFCRLVGSEMCIRDRPWAPPTGLGPMPSDLSDRASSVLSRQSALVARLVEARSAVQQQLGAVRRVEASHEPGRPVYLDALG
ncbi:hypothetical protein FRIG_15515 [Frigoribacterium faeni]|uniref:hypothetical protein n=1 Tax=Frigoribacterium faeni TaxID=145483 RepID=UPI001FAB8F2B|nr:hypothetical protein [Frigoribacterium faeni]MCJ0702523.1 hypothetical protein [Frigoribacterium faeni]